MRVPQSHLFHPSFLSGYNYLSYGENEKNEDNKDLKIKFTYVPNNSGFLDLRKMIS